MWKYNLLDFFYNTPALLVPPSPDNVHIYTMKEHQYFYFVLQQAHGLARSLQISSLVTFQLYETKFLLLFLHSFHQCASKKSLVYIDGTLYLA